MLSAACLSGRRDDEVAPLLTTAVSRLSPRLPPRWAGAARRIGQRGALSATAAPFAVAKALSPSRCRLRYRPPAACSRPSACPTDRQRVTSRRPGARRPSHRRAVEASLVSAAAILRDRGDRRGAAGTVSTVTETAGEIGLTLPAASVSVAARRTCRRLALRASQGAPSTAQAKEDVAGTSVKLIVWPPR